jgi:hypothetical protein
MQAHVILALPLLLAAVTGGTACSLLADEQLSDKPTEAKAGGGDDGEGGVAGGAASTSPAPIVTPTATVIVTPGAGSSCPPGYGDCDGNPKNGCETRLDTSPDDCGACGHACAPGEKCDQGTCRK